MPLLDAEAIIVEDVFFPTGSDRLNGELCYAEADKMLGAAALAGPHPLLGGSMRNNVVTALGNGLAANGIAALRFDYRGVGRSEGPPVEVAQHLNEFWATSHLKKEMDFAYDVAAAATFLRSVVPAPAPLALIGYSFGCALLPRVQAPLSLYVLIAPTLGKHDFAPYLEVSEPMLVVTSDNDFAADSASLDAWFSSLKAPKRMVRQRLDNHFFRGHESWLTRVVADFLHEHWSV